MENNYDNINTIIFDLGGVLFEESNITILREIAKILKYKDKSEKYKELKKKLVKVAEIESRYFTSENCEKFYSDVVDECNIPLNSDQFKEIYNKIVVNKNMIPIVKKLKSMGYSLYILSDQIKDRADCMHKYIKENYDDIFDHVYFSHEIECSKSNGGLGIFLEKTAEECLFVDDNPKNIKVAKNYGYKTIQFRNPDQFIEELNKKIFDKNRKIMQKFIFFPFHKN